MFIDTGAFFARYRSDDDHHVSAVERWKKIALARRPCVTTSFIVAEAITLLSREFGCSIAAERARAIYASTVITVINPSEEDQLLAIDLLERYADQRVYFVDCVSFVIMRRQKLKTAFGFDRHFKMAGFGLWPKQ